jgi:hypothetical protein
MGTSAEPPPAMDPGSVSRSEAQRLAGRIRPLREGFALLEREGVLTLTPDQRTRFEEWAARTLAALASRFDVDTSDAQTRLSWGLRIASTLGAIALCAALVLFFQRFWGYLTTPAQVSLLIAAPLLALAGAEWAARLEKTLYFAGLLAFIALACFILDLAVLGDIFNITSTENALLALGAFAALLAYRYGLRPLLVPALVLLVCWASAALVARLGWHWSEFLRRPESLAFLGLALFAFPFVVRHTRYPDFPAVYRLVGLLLFFFFLLSLSEWGGGSFLPFAANAIGTFYGVLGMLSAAGAIWLGIRRDWTGAVNLAAVFFVVFLYIRFYHWWWDWMPHYLFFAVLGAIAIALVVAFKRLRSGRKGALA